MAPSPRCVLHVDVDAFFTQVHERLQPELRGRPLAVQQHQDIISLNHAAKALGARKHMAPNEARALLQPANGAVVHVKVEKGGFVSYQPYLDHSASFVRTVRAAVADVAATVENASIDEVFVELRVGDVGGGDVALSVGRGVADFIARRCLSELDLSVSVGVAGNRLLAKLASVAAKPAGVRVVYAGEDTDALLRETPASKLPRCGTREVAARLAELGISTATGLQGLPVDALSQRLGLAPKVAARLHDHCRGVCDEPIVDKGPRKSISVGMTLTDRVLPMHPSHANEVSVAGGTRGMIEPVRAGAEPERMRSVAARLAEELALRTLQDASETLRWPQTLEVSLQTHGGECGGQRRTRFPERMAPTSVSGVAAQLAAKVSTAAASLLDKLAAPCRDALVKKVSLTAHNLQASRGHHTSLDTFFAAEHHQPRLPPPPQPSVAGEPLQEDAEVGEQDAVPTEEEMLDYDGGLPLRAAAMVRALAGGEVQPAAINSLMRKRARATSGSG